MTIFGLLFPDTFQIAGDILGRHCNVSCFG